MKSFTATIQRSDKPGGWWCVVVPSETKKALQPLFVGGNAKVMATVGTTTWPVTIMAMGGGHWMVPLKADIRESEELQTGQEITVTITPRKSND